MNNFYNIPEPISTEKTVTLTEAEYLALTARAKKRVSKYTPKKRFTEIPGERWKLIEGTANYEISTLGRIRRFTCDSYGAAFVSMVGPKPVNNMLQHRLYLGCGLTKNIYVHKVVKETFEPAPVTGMVVYHINGNTLDNRLVNLGYRPRKINEAVQKLKSKDYISKTDGLVKVKRSKLSIADIQQIQKLLKAGVPQKKIAEQFNISQAYVSKLSNTGLKFIDGKAYPYTKTRND